MHRCGAGYVTRSRGQSVEKSVGNETTKIADNSMMTRSDQSAKKPAGNETIKIVENSMGRHMAAGTTLSSMYRSADQMMIRGDQPS
jgi:hypothetical protein